MAENSKIAVFFDAENVSHKYTQKVINFLHNEVKGEIVFQRAYADWSIQNMSGWKEQLLKTPITAIQQFHEKEDKGKESVDKALMMDAIEMAVMHSEIDIFAIVASDNGYYSLALKLRGIGKRVIGLGAKAFCNQIWTSSCNQFRYFEELEDDDDGEILLSEKKPNEKASQEGEALKEFSLENFLTKAFDSTSTYKDTNSVLVSRLWESILRMKSDFNVKNYGKKNAIELLKSYPQIFEVSDDGKAQKTYFVAKIGNSAPENSLRKTGEIKRTIKSYCIIAADNGDYFFYRGDINPDFSSEKLKVGDKVDFAVKKMPNPAATETRDKNGRAVDLKMLLE